MQQDIDEEVTGSGLVVVASVRRDGGLCGCDLNLQLGNLRLVGSEPFVPVRQLACMSLVLLFELRGQTGDLIARQRRRFRCEGGVELSL